LNRCANVLELQQEFHHVVVQNQVLSDCAVAKVARLAFEDKATQQTQGSGPKVSPLLQRRSGEVLGHTRITAVEANGLLQRGCAVHQNLDSSKHQILCEASEPGGKVNMRLGHLSTSTEKPAIEEMDVPSQY
jgi:hypothetical protein